MKGFETQLKKSGTYSSGDSGKGQVVPSSIDLSSDVVMKKLFGISSSARRGYDAVLVAKNQVVENESAHKKVEGDLDNEHVSCGGELGNQSLSMSQKGANQLEHFANVLRGRAVDVVHESTGVAWGYGMNRERSYTKAGADVCPRGFYESCVPDSTKKASTYDNRRACAEYGMSS